MSTTTYTVTELRRVAGTIIAVSALTILVSFLLLLVNILSRPAQPATRRSRIAWYLLGVALLLLGASHVLPIVGAVSHLRHLSNDAEGDRIADRGRATFSLQALAVVAQLVACRAVFYASMDDLRNSGFNAPRNGVRVFKILDSVAVAALLGTFIYALTGADGNSMCRGGCTQASQMAILFFENGMFSGGMQGVALVAMVVVFGGVICAARWSRKSPLARALSPWLLVIVGIQFMAHLLVIVMMIFYRTVESESGIGHLAIYYGSVPFWLVQPLVLSVLQNALRSAPVTAPSGRGAIAGTTTSEAAEPKSTHNASTRTVPTGEAIV